LPPLFVLPPPSSPSLSNSRPAELSEDRNALAQKQAEIAALERQKGTLPAEVETAKVKEEAILQQLQQTKAGEKWVGMGEREEGEGSIALLRGAAPMPRQ
jgi:hypothetical protein